MKLFLATAALAATAAFAAPAMSAECVSDLIKADAIIQSGQLGPSTARAADALAGQAKTAKTDGEFERCTTLTRELMAMIDPDATGYGYVDEGPAYN